MPIFSKMCFLLVTKLWSLSELPFTSYERFSPKSPYGANGEGKERVKIRNLWIKSGQLGK